MRRLARPVRDSSTVCPSVAHATRRARDRPAAIPRAALRAAESMATMALAPDARRAPTRVRAEKLDHARETKRATRGNARPNALKRGVANAARAMGGESEVFRAWDQATKSQKRTDLKKIMILGAGPIVIGQVRARDDALADGRRGERRGMGGGDRERERGARF